MTEVFILKDKQGIGELLNEYFGRSIKISKTLQGAPYIVDNDKNISISHKNNCLVVALSDKAVGVDIEKIYQKESHIKIAKRYFTSKEIDYITAPERFFILWTRKEALGKLLGVGLNSTTIAIETVKNSVSFENKKYFFQSNLSILEDYCITVASEEKNVEFCIRIDS